MEQHLFTASTLACACTVAMGQTSVQVYGIADAGVNHLSGLKGGSVTQVASGIMEGSRLGFKGNEDLGGGYRAIFLMEHRIELDTGSFSNRPQSGSQVPDRLTAAALLATLPAAQRGNIAFQRAFGGFEQGLGSSIGVNVVDGNFWDRQVYVGLVTPVGAVLAGRQYTPAYEVSASFDTLGTQSSLAAGQVAALPSSVDIRVSNALQYRIQTGGITAGAMYALGEGSARTGRLAGFMGMYKASGFSVGVGYNTRKNELAEKSLTSTVLGASVDVGPGSAYLQYATVKDDHPTGVSFIASAVSAAFAGTPLAPSAPVTVGAAQKAYAEALKQDGRLLHVGYKAVFGPHTGYVAYTKYDDKRPADADVASYGFCYSYSFSKRTDLNVVLTHFNNNPNAQAAPGQAGFIGGVTASKGTDSNNWALGLRHRF